MPTMTQLESRIAKLEKEMSEIREVVGFLPPLIKPLEWQGLTDRDKKVLDFLIKQPRDKTFTTTQIAENIGLENAGVTGRVHVWNSLKRIRRIAGKKRKQILEYDNKTKSWILNKWDFMYPEDAARLAE